MDIENEILELQKTAVNLQVNNWLQHELFSYQWWILIALLILPWLIWWKYADRKRLTEILLLGLVAATVVTIIDEIGCQLNLWEYAYDIEPLFPRMIPVNLTVLPVIYMLIYQFFSDWKSYLIANVVTAALLSFIAENILEFMEIYQLYKWENYYSFPIYIIIAIFLKWFTQLILSKQKARESE